MIDFNDIESGRSPNAVAVPTGYAVPRRFHSSGYNLGHVRRSLDGCETMSPGRTAGCRLRWTGNYATERNPSRQPCGPLPRNLLEAAHQTLEPSSAKADWAGSAA
jgi:hypothetical protein